VRSFSCRNCDSQLFFENSVCLTCGTGVGFSREERALVPVDGSGRYVDPAGLLWHVCRNLNLSGCTWLARLEGGQCMACDLTRTRPADGDSAGLAQFPKAEAAKRHLLVELDSRGFSTEGLVFDMLSSTSEDVTIGHAGGVITIDLAEADGARREQIREELGEPYRTMLGHLRHEVGHFLQLRLVTGGARLDQFRQLFGDEREDYQSAVARHYAEGPPTGWWTSYISSYAATHPFEDFAETFAHYLHIAETCETAAEHGLLATEPPTFGRFRDLVGQVWIPLSLALNQINRSMGKDDLYPFVIPEPVLDKLDFIALLAFDGRSAMQ